MKTLDEVINELHYWDTCDAFPESFYDFEVTTDALHYLKVLKDILSPQKVKKISHEITCPQCNSVIAILLPESNEPLTWDELKQMEGKPVWVEGKTVKHWAVITGIYYDDLNEGYLLETYYAEKQGSNTSRRKRSTLGNTWQAYRKERE